MASRLRSWSEVIRTQNLADPDRSDAISRWLLIMRASVLPMTLTSAAIGGLLCVAGPTPVPASAALFLEALVGLLLAHAGNNMLNDYFDLTEGVDTDGYVRTRYAPHPILSGLVSRRGLLAAIVTTHAVDLAVLVHLTWVRGWPVAAFALAGLFISVFYVAPPLKLKHHGLGEPGVLLVWGPLMICGTYYVTAGVLPAWVWAASLPYAVLVMAVLVAKHVDKLEADAERGIRTLPVLLGHARARRLAQVLMVGFFVLVALLVATGTLGVWCLAVLLGARPLVQTLRVFGRPAPEAPPPGYPIWPLWYVAWAFRLTRGVGALFVLGLAGNALLPVFV